MGSSLSSRIVSSSVLRISFTISSAIVAYLLLPFLAHNLGARDYGLWAIVITIIGYYNMMDFGIASAVGRFVGRSYAINDYEEINRVISTAVIIFLCVAGGLIILTAVGSLSTFYFLENDREATKIYLMILILSASFSTVFPLRAMAGLVYASVSHYITVSIEYIKLFLKTSLTVIAILMDCGILTLAIVYAIAEIIGNTVHYFFILKSFPDLKVRRTLYSKTSLIELFKYGWVAFIARISNMMKIRAIPLLVSALISVEFVVMYMVALRLMEYINQLVTTTTGIFGPIFSRLSHNKENLKNTYKLSSQIIVVISTYIGLSVAFYSKWLIPVWMGEGFGLSYSITLLFCLPFIVISLQYISRETLFGLSKHKYCAIIDSAEVILIVLGSILLTKYFGVYGIVISFALIVTFGELIFPYLVSKILGMNPFKVYLDVFIIPMLKVAMPLSVYFYYISAYMNNSYWSLMQWNIIQVLIFSPVLFISLPKDMQKFISSKMVSLIPIKVV